MKQYFLTITLLLMTNQIVSAQICQDRVTAHTPDSRFTTNGQEITDTKTGLIWQKCALGQTGDHCNMGDTQKLDWASALQVAEAEAQQTGKAWRLPNIKELLSIVEIQCTEPAINLTIFPNTPHSDFWSASPPVNHSSYAWYVSFYAGSSGSDGETHIGFVRLVRKGQ